MPIVKSGLFSTLVAGGLDILSAFLFSGLAGHGPLVVLRGVASGPFGDRMVNGGLQAAFIGLCVHFVITANIVTVFVAVAASRPWLIERPFLVGPFYGFLVYLVMYCVVLPIRYPGVFPQHDPSKIAKALFSHIICVGLPIALLNRKSLGACLVSGRDDRIGATPRPAP